MLQARPGKNFHQKLYISYDSKIFLQICTVDLLSTSSAWQASMVENVKLKHDLDTIFWNFCTIFLHSALSKIDLILAILMLKAQAGLSKSIDLGHVMRCGHLIYLRKLEIIKVSW